MIRCPFRRTRRAPTCPRRRSFEISPRPSIPVRFAGARPRCRRAPNQRRGYRTRGGRLCGPQHTAPLVAAVADYRGLSRYGFTRALTLARGTRAAIDEIDGLEVMHDELLGVEASHDPDLLQVLIDVSATGASGYQAADWLRAHRRLDMGLSDHRRVLATLSPADDELSADALIDGLALWRAGLADPRSPAIVLPKPEELQLDTVMLPRDAFFAATEVVPAERAVGRIAAEQLTPYPPGIPAIVPGERIDAAVVDYLRTGVAAGMNVPDASDPGLDTLRVVATGN